MYQLTPFADIPLDADLLEHLIDQHTRVRLAAFGRLWRYFRNELAPPSPSGGSDGPPQQRSGLPLRLRNERGTVDDRFRREIVIENDIAWRIHTLVDFMFPRSPQIVSRAADRALRERIEQALARIIEASGGVQLWQDAALLGSVYGHVDLLVDCDGFFEAAAAAASSSPRHGDSSPSSTDLSRGTRAAAAAQAHARTQHVRPGTHRPAEAMIRIEAVEAPRAIPLLNQHDYRSIDAYILHFERPVHDVEHQSMLARILSRSFLSGARLHTDRATATITQIHSAKTCQRYRDEALVHESLNRLGRIPVVHIQNQSQPYCYEGLSDVEPLIPLQDELNIRLSDRANRVTMQSFRMWLGKGIDGFNERPIGPGQMWMTDNENASIEAFGGDADSPSEKQHIEELREALDKASGVTPAAAGHIKARIGNLTSENALRVSLMGTIAKVKRKRITYGRGIAQLCDLLLHALHIGGVLHTDPAERGVEIVWPDPLPADESRRIADALAKAQLGVPLEQLRAELGYGT